jgi:hypothetical protein
MCKIHQKRRINLMVIIIEIMIASRDLSVSSQRHELHIYGRVLKLPILGDLCDQYLRDTT